MLAGAMRDHRGPLSAAVWAEYRIDIEKSPVGAMRLADMVAMLPPGCALWRATGGPMAWSMQEQMLAVIEFRLREQMHQAAGKKGGKPPKPMEPPPLASEAKAEAARMSTAQSRFMERFGNK